MKNILLLLAIITGCINSQQRNNQISLHQNEDFSHFYSKFYNDTIYQNERILKPLKGSIKTWNDNVIKEEFWDNKKITITSKEKFLEVYKNLKTDLIKKDTIVTEKYWIEQSGFFIEKSFILKSGKWYLYSYNISNL